jgi:hypothetical protein
MNEYTDEALQSAYLKLCTGATYIPFHVKNDDAMSFIDNVKTDLHMKLLSAINTCKINTQTSLLETVWCENNSTTSVPL